MEWQPFEVRMSWGNDEFRFRIPRFVGEVTNLVMEFIDSPKATVMANISWLPKHGSVHDTYPIIDLAERCLN